MIRNIVNVKKSRPTIEGAGVHLRRAFGFQQVPRLDPFLLLDDFHGDDPEKYIAGFPWHPHRGIETITYVLHGKVEHGDSMGNSGVIAEGDVQWMTAGSGIIHQEMPKGDDSGLLWGFQLWANLPAKHKMMEPRYQEIKAATIPEVVLDNGARVKLICGELGKTRGPVKDIMTAPEYLDVTLPANGVFDHAITKGHTAFAYVIEGSAHFDERHDPYAYEAEGTGWWDIERDCTITGATLVVYGDGDEVRITASGSGVRFLLISGRPIKEPVAWYGPIVMNTQEELRVAFEEYNNGTFLKHGEKK
jgi:quercetin 2,3-dioxygenase